MEKKDFIFEMIQQSKKEFNNNQVIDAQVGIEYLREKYSFLKNSAK